MPADSMSLPVACALLFELWHMASRLWAAALMQCAVTMLMPVSVLCAKGPRWGSLLSNSQHGGADAVSPAQPC